MTLIENLGLQVLTYLLKGILFTAFIVFLVCYIIYHLSNMFWRRLSVHIQTKGLEKR